MAAVLELPDIPLRPGPLTPWCSAYDDGKLLYAGRARSGLTPASRVQLFELFNALPLNAGEPEVGQTTLAIATL
jgi:hypothetical protein